MFDLEDWVITLLKTIKICSDHNLNSYVVVLNREQLKQISDAYDKLKWIEIY